MNQAQHTPGPERLPLPFHKEYLRRETGNEYHVCDPTSRIVARCTTELECDAIIGACNAAPDLLAALEEAHKALDYIVGCGDDNMLLAGDAAAIARAAIKAARGEQ